MFKKNWTYQITRDKVYNIIYSPQNILAYIDIKQYLTCLAFLKH